jgi:hypothetical protein
VISPGTPASSTNKTDRHDITELLLKVTLNAINQAKPNYGMKTTSYFLEFSVTDI